MFDIVSHLGDKYEENQLIEGSGYRFIQDGKHTTSFSVAGMI